MTRPRFLGALLGLAVLILPASAKPTPAEWKKLESDARNAFAGNNGDDRVKAALAVGGADCLDGVKLLVKLLDTPDQALATAEAARDAYEPEFATALARIVKFAKQGNGQVAVNELELFQKKEKQMSDLNEKVHALSAVPDAIGEALAKTRDPEAVKWLTEEALKDKSWRTRASVGYALGFVPAENALANPALQGALADKDGRVRSAAIEALARRGAKDAAPA
ncbi:MAG: HEAT repeat domain-containing protein, partial [Planctomycetes bacterium]|nr:HEAT repeat domain-containing protein [Planctomycetota bacterium]